MPFKPGQSGNPKGRPKEKPIRDMIRLVLQDGVNSGTKRQLRHIIEKMIEQAADGDKEARRDFFDRYEGKVPQTIAGDDELDPVTVRTIVTGVPRDGDG